MDKITYMKHIKNTNIFSKQATIYNEPTQAKLRVVLINVSHSKKT